QHPAIIFEPEVGKRRAIAWNEMERAAASWASRFRSIGIKPGDRIAGYLPNIPEAVLSMLGASAIGATWSSTSPDFGFEGVVDRFSQIEPRALIVSDGYYYQGKWHALNERLQTLLERLPSVEVVYLVPYSAELAPALEKS